MKVLCMLLILPLCGCGLTSLSRVDTVVIEKERLPTGELVTMKSVEVQSKPDAILKVKRNADGSYEYTIDNRGRRGFAEQLGDATVQSLSNSELFIGTGGTSKGEDKKD